MGNEGYAVARDGIGLLKNVTTLLRHDDETR